MKRYVGIVFIVILLWSFTSVRALTPIDPQYFPIQKEESSNPQPAPGLPGLQPPPGLEEGKKQTKKTCIEQWNNFEKNMMQQSFFSLQRGKILVRFIDGVSLEEADNIIEGYGLQREQLKNPLMAILPPKDRVFSVHEQVEEEKIMFGTLKTLTVFGEEPTERNQRWWNKLLQTFNLQKRVIVAKEKETGCYLLLAHKKIFSTSPAFSFDIAAIQEIAKQAP